MPSKFQIPSFRCIRHRAPAHAARCGLAVVLAAHATGCQGADSDAPASVDAKVWVEKIVSLDDLDQPILGRPGRISVDRQGRFIIADHSDRSIKIYSAGGRRVDTFGRRGRGPGEFEYLLDAGVVGDRIFGYDHPTNQLTYFAEDGSVLQTVSLVRGGLGKPQAYSITATDENHFLFATAPQKDVNLLRITGLDGTTLKEFFPLDAKWTTPEALWQGIFLPDHIWHQADALDGLVFSGMWGGKTLHVFDYDGTLQGSGPVDATEPLISLPELLEQNNGRIRDADGVSIQNGNRVIRRVVATEGAMVAVQVAPFNTVVGADPLDGGTLIALRWRDGTLSEIGRLQSEWGLFGRDADGHALVMRYATQDTYDLGRVMWGDSTSR